MREMQRITAKRGPFPWFWAPLKISAMRVGMAHFKKEDDRNEVFERKGHMAYTGLNLQVRNRNFILKWNGELVGCPWREEERDGHVTGGSRPSGQAWQPFAADVANRSRPNIRQSTIQCFYTQPLAVTYCLTSMELIQRRALKLSWADLVSERYWIDK